MSKNTNINNKRKLGKGMRYNNSGTIECYGTLHNKRGDSIKYSFTRKTKQEIEETKARIILLGTLDNDIEKIKIGRNNNEIELIRKRGKEKE